MTAIKQYCLCSYRSLEDFLDDYRNYIIAEYSHNILYSHYILCCHYTVYSHYIIYTIATTYYKVYNLHSTIASHTISNHNLKFSTLRAGSSTTNTPTTKPAKQSQNLDHSSIPSKYLKVISTDLPPAKLEQVLGIISSMYGMFTYIWLIYGVHKGMHLISYQLAQVLGIISTCVVLTC